MYWWSNKESVENFLSCKGNIHVNVSRCSLYRVWSVHTYMLQVKFKWKKNYDFRSFLSHRRAWTYGTSPTGTARELASKRPPTSSPRKCLWSGSPRLPPVHSGGPVQHQAGRAPETRRPSGLGEAGHGRALKISCGERTRITLPSSTQSEYRSCLFSHFSSEI